MRDPLRPLTVRRWLPPLLATTLVVAAGGTASTPAAAAASAAPRASAIVSPTPGQRITRSTVRFVVRAGPEHRDLIARLNGVSIGEEFERRSSSTRTLRLTASHGLRHGRNELRVTARRGGKLTRSTVRFTVAHDFPIVGAGRRTRGTVGTAHHLRGRVTLPSKRATTPRIRWSVVRAPRGSRFAPKRAATRPGRAASRAASAPLVPVTGPGRGLTDTDTTSPLFTADRAGRYVLRMTVGSGADARSASVPVDIGPRSAVVEIDTAIDGADPAGARSSGATNGRPGIRVGGVVYRAPAMRGAENDATYGGYVREGTSFRAQWQVVVLDRRTLGLVWNRTYGSCTAPASAPFPCRRGSDDQPQRVSMSRELRQIDDAHLVIVASHPTPSGGEGARAWASPGQAGSEPDALTAVGFPGASLLADVPAGGAAMIGVGTLDAGRAKYDVATRGRAALRGHLIADVNGHYDYVSTTRSSFDTAAGNDCAAAGDPCDVRIDVGDDRVSAPQPAGTSGFLIAVHDERTLERQASQVFSSHVDLARIHEFVERYAASGNLFTVTSFGNLTVGGVIDRTAARLASAAIERIGGTRHAFNSALMTPGQRYTLIGWSDAGRGEGDEALRVGARLRGALAPDAAGKLRPANVSHADAPAERLQRLLLAPPTTAWPLDDDRGASAALTWIGQQVPQLGGDPRQAYWRQAASTIAVARTAVDRLRYPSDASGFTARDFATAQDQLLTELDWVANVRDYFARLAFPSETAGRTVWQEASILQNRLEAEVDLAKEAAEQTTGGWMAVLESLLSLASGGTLSLNAAHSIEALIHVAMAAVEAGEASWELMHAGGEPIDENPRVRADELAVSLQHRSQRTVDALYRMGNAIISDPRKLAEVGRWAGCLPNAASGGCPAGFEEYAVTPAATQQATTLARMALERTLYAELVPLSFPVWDLGLTANPDPAQNLTCTGSLWLSSPFYDAPRAAWTSAVEDAGTATMPPLSRTLILVRRDGLRYSWPSQRVLDRMLGPVSGIDEESGLGLSPYELMRDAENRFEPGVDCHWNDTRPQGPILD